MNDGDLGEIGGGCCGLIVFALIVVAIGYLLKVGWNLA